LRMDAGDPGKVAAARLRLAIDQPIVLQPAVEAPAPIPVRRVRQVIEDAPEARHQLAVAIVSDEGRLVPPSEADEHRVVVVHRDPGAVVQMSGELALWRL